MKNLIIFGLFIIALIMVQFAHGQTVEDVLEKYINASGGKEKLATLNTIRMEGNMTVQGADVTIINTRMHNVGSRTDISVMGTENYQLVTPAAGWIFMPIFGQAAQQPMPDDQLKADQLLIDLHGSLVNFKDKGSKVELAGKETVDAIECYKLKVTSKNGNITDYYIDTKTNHLYKTSTKAIVNGEETDAYTIFSNYKQNADGYWFAYTTATSRGEINYDKILTNIKVDENIFKAN